ncbi:unnamed protein product [marine sediment metagenome]|uniref:Uncharacterized protein n=1 Tax=marine sediment metagenome TaxID=412755 RepID=X0Z244_9ZZZZ
MSTHEGRFLEMQDRETPRLFAPRLGQAIEDDPEVLGVDAAVGPDRCGAHVLAPFARWLAKLIGLHA